MYCLRCTPCLAQHTLLRLNLRHQSKEFIRCAIKLKFRSVYQFPVELQNETGLLSGEVTKSYPELSTGLTVKLLKLSNMDLASLQIAFITVKVYYFKLLYCITN